MPGPARIEGYAIVSADGMLADAERRMPDGLKVEADQKFFHDGLDRAAAIVHGRHSHEGGPRAAGRRRLVVTRTVPGLAPDPSRPNGLLWNPQGASLSEAWAALAPPDGMLAVIGGPEVYRLFLDIGYDAFHLTRAPHVHLPGGRPVFPGIGPDRTPEDLLAGAGLRPGAQSLLDPTADVTLVTWERSAPGS
jgi:dihydrofolate reductase